MHSRKQSMAAFHPVWRSIDVHSAWCCRVPAYQRSCGGTARQVVEAAPEALRGPADVSLLADFFSARLADWCGRARRAFCSDYGHHGRRGTAAAATTAHERTAPGEWPADRREGAYACRPSVKGALRGCVALMRRRSAGMASLDGATATQVMRPPRRDALPQVDVAALWFERPSHVRHMGVA